MDGFHVGDRVVRPANVFEPSKLRHGEVVERYRRERSFGDSGTDYELYAVRWDDTGYVERGYLRHGLNPEPLSLGGLGV